MNILRYYEEFAEALTDYRHSRQAQDLLADLRLALLVAPSSSGRNTIIRELLKTGEYHFIISDTTRNPRVNDGVPEQDGVDYWFRSEEHVLEDIREGNFLEAALIHKQQVSGVSIRELRRAHDDNKIAITDVNPDGAANIHLIKPDTVSIFVVPPSFPVWIERLHHRGALPEEEVRRRLESAVSEFETALREDYYTYVVNDDLSQAVQKVYEATRDGRQNEREQMKSRTIIERLLQDTAAYLQAG